MKILRIGNASTMMFSSVFVFLIVVAAALAAFGPTYGDVPEDYLTDSDNEHIHDQVIVPHKRAALLIDRLLVELNKVLREKESQRRTEVELDGPRTAPLRLPNIETNDMTGLQRRGQGPRGRVLRCYFNAITCF